MWWHKFWTKFYDRIWNHPCIDQFQGGPCRCGKYAYGRLVSTNPPPMMRKKLPISLPPVTMPVHIPDEQVHVPDVIQSKSYTIPREHE